jgi:hypothetical protein
MQTDLFRPPIYGAPQSRHFLTPPKLTFRGAKQFGVEHLQNVGNGEDASPISVASCKKTHENGISQRNFRLQLGAPDDGYLTFSLIYVGFFNTQQPTVLVP